MSKDPIAVHLEVSLAALQRATSDAALLDVARKIAAVIIAALRSGNKLLIVGNGGSAADAQHIAAAIGLRRGGAVITTDAILVRTVPCEPRSHRHAS